MGHSANAVQLILAVFCVWNVEALTIQVVDSNGSAIKQFTDGNAAFQQRSYLIPDSRNTAIVGPLVYPNPRNACSPVASPQNDTYIAFLENFLSCPQQSEENLKVAGFYTFIAYSNDTNAFLSREFPISQALFFDSNFRNFLEDNVISNGSEVYELVIWDDAFVKLERLFIIFGAVLLVAVVLSVCVFCSSLFCRMALIKWRTRGLSTWQVRSLPKRKFRKVKESTDTCSICLEEFKEGETVRVLPCDHVFHPKCVDEWLQKWNRTCPLCKSTIKRSGARPHLPSALTDDNESSLLLPQHERASLVSPDGRSPAHYGTTGGTPALHTATRHHRRGGSGSSTTSNASSSSGRRNRVTSADIELAGSAEQVRPASVVSVYQTPIHSDDETDPSYTTAYNSQASGGIAAEQV